jgi:hypothetical protein
MLYPLFDFLLNLFDSIIDFQAGISLKLRRRLNGESKFNLW